MFLQVTGNELTKFRKIMWIITGCLLFMFTDTEHIFNASACGDNCAKWILQIAHMHEEQGKDLSGK